MVVIDITLTVFGLETPPLFIEQYIDLGSDEKIKNMMNLIVVLIVYI